MLSEGARSASSRTTAAPHSVVHVVFLFDVILYHPRDGRHSLHLGLQGTQ